MSRITKRKWWFIGGAIIIIGIIGFSLLRSQNGNRAAQALNPGDIVTVTVGDLASTASASGEVVARKSANLSLLSSGQVDEIFVAVGDFVTVGQPLLQLKQSDLERAVQSSEQALLIQEANLATRTAVPSAEDVAAAEAALISAQAQLEDLLDGPNPNDIAAAEANLRAANADLNAAYARVNNLVEAADDDEIQAAEIALETAQRDATRAAEQHSTILVTEPNQFIGEAQLADIEEQARAAAVAANANLLAAQETLDALLNGDSNSVGAAQAGVNAAAANRDSAQAQLDLLLAGPTASQIAAAENSVAQAEAALDNLISGLSDSQRLILEVQVEQAQLNLAQAQLNLEQATLRAPFDGVITAVQVSEGEFAAGPVIQITDLDNLEIVLQVDEVDIGQFTGGQDATVTVEAWPGQEIEATIDAISPKNLNSGLNALVTYDVFLTILDSDLPLLVGMTANANLITDKRSEVLLVPNRAITTNRQAGTFSVTKVLGDETEVVDVTIGLRDGQFTEITSGLNVGDQLLIEDSSPVQNFGPPGT